MKKLALTFTLLLTFSLLTFSQNDYKMFQLVYLNPLPGADMDEAKTAILDHNKKFHSEDPFQSSLWSNLTGEMAGTWVWVMGPSTFSDYDNRPSDDAHDSDWQSAVRGKFDLVTIEYWKMDDKLSYAPEGHEHGNKVVWSVYDLKAGDSYRFKEMVKKITKVYEEKKYKHDFTVYWNRFDNREGRDVVIENSFKKWSFMDRDRTFKKDFEEVHGEGSWWKLIEEYRDIIESNYDELSVKMK